MNRTNAKARLSYAGLAGRVQRYRAHVFQIIGVFAGEAAY
jgi:hypothetical protein